MLKRRFTALLAVLLLLPLATGCDSGKGKKKSAPGKSSKKNSSGKKRGDKKRQASSKIPPVDDNAYQDIPAAVAALVASANKEGDRQWVQATRWLLKQGEAARKPLAKVLHDESEGVPARIYACRTLSQLGPSAADDLRAALTSKADLVRVNAVEQLGIIKPTNPQIIETLVGLMDHSDKKMRRYSIRALAKIGPPAKKCVPKLQTILDSTSEEEIFRTEAKQALLKINPRRTFND